MIYKELLLLDIPRSLVISLILVVSGCAHVDPYAEIGIGYQIDHMSDWYLRTDRDWTCSNGDTFHAELGLEFDHDWRVGYHHQSHISCGGPFNSHPEVYQDEIILTKKFGGRK